MPDRDTPEHSHEPVAIAERLKRGHAVNYLSDWVYGGIDGAITTFAIVAGSLGADLSNRIILILGAANILADGLSMAAANFTGTKAENDDEKRLRAVEERHIRIAPKGEREEIRQIFASKGFKGADLDRVVDVITSDKQLWIDTMITEEYGLASARRSPMKAAFATFFGFLICGLVPLLPFVLGLGDNAAPVAVVLTAAAFFTIGITKSRWSQAAWWASGLETLGIGLGAAAIAYFIGDLLNTLL